jgi:hypothetical protein
MLSLSNLPLNTRQLAAGMKVDVSPPERRGNLRGDGRS